jgi:hypothetical protein
MIGLLLNCSGVGKKGFAFYLKDLMFEYDFDFIGLQETMKRNVDVSICRKFDSEAKYTWLWSPLWENQRWNPMWDQILQIWFIHCYQQ